MSDEYGHTLCHEDTETTEIAIPQQVYCETTSDVEASFPVMENTRIVSEHGYAFLPDNKSLLPPRLAADISVSERSSGRKCVTEGHDKQKDKIVFSNGQSNWRPSCWTNENLLFDGNKSEMGQDSVVWNEPDSDYQSTMYWEFGNSTGGNRLQFRRRQFESLINDYDVLSGDILNQDQEYGVYGDTQFSPLDNNHGQTGIPNEIDSKSGNFVPGSNRKMIPSYLKLGGNFKDLADLGFNPLAPYAKSESHKSKPRRDSSAAKLMPKKTVKALLKKRPAHEVKIKQKPKRIRSGANVRKRLFNKKSEVPHQTQKNHAKRRMLMTKLTKKKKNDEWCICRRPHGGRFMICCDSCNEWYHGSCVKVSINQGKRMSKAGEEYICPNCQTQKQVNRTAVPKQVSRTATSKQVNQIATPKQVSRTAAPKQVNRTTVTKDVDFNKSPRSAVEKHVAAKKDVISFSKTGLFEIKRPRRHVLKFSLSEQDTEKKTPQKKTEKRRDAKAFRNKQILLRKRIKSLRRFKSTEDSVRSQRGTRYSEKDVNHEENTENKTVSTPSKKIPHSLSSPPVQNANLIATQEKTLSLSEPQPSFKSASGISKSKKRAILKATLIKNKFAIKKQLSDMNSTELNFGDGAQKKTDSKETEETSSRVSRFRRRENDKDDDDLGGGGGRGGDGGSAPGGGSDGNVASAPRSKSPLKDGAYNKEKRGNTARNSDSKNRRVDSKTDRRKSPRKKSHLMRSPSSAHQIASDSETMKTMLLIENALCVKFLIHFLGFSVVYSAVLSSIMLAHAETYLKLSLAAKLTFCEHRQIY